ncbi:unnamed protein product [Mytilus coruscus]|uniref:Uncharacterized protein n=1 Tax=Mytilus coruscus TaxID=42192 RepID=A0A6J8EUH9_MYTCO|nr:unnamed protein product [Mytilus coruscus]
MAKRIRLSSVSTDSWETDWSKCCLCQEDTVETLKLTADGYKMLATNIPKFLEMNSLPIPLDVRRFNNGSGIESTLTTNEAKYNPSCRIKFNNTKLKRAEQRYESTKSIKSEPCSLKFIRRSIDHSDTKLKQDIVKCFLCDKEAPPSSLRKAMKMKLNDRLKSCAETLQDKQLLAKLSIGDVIAQDLKYHPACLVALYNKERAVKKKTEQAQIDTNAEKEAGDVALAELVNYVFETQRNSDGANAFRLADLSNMTRLKEMFLAKIPDLQAYTKGREVLLVFEKDVGPAIALACNYDDTIHIGKTAEIIRTQIKEHKTKFSGSFSAEYTQSSVPTSLLELVCMIEHGPDIQSQLENSVCKSDLAIAQLLMYNYHAKTPKVSEQQRHAVDREPPFCIYIGLLIFARTRKRLLIDILFQYGLCISYHWVLEISTQLGDAVVERFLSEGLVCPPVLKKGLFTTAAVDNIDHNPSSTTAKTSFHGTGIFIFQHPSDDISGIERGDLILGNRSNSR